jgi:hypothetical protein
MANVSMRVGQEYTIKEFITNYGVDDFTYDTLFYKDVFNTSKGNILINGNSILDRYANELPNYKTRLTFDESDYRKYSYNPKILSYDIYGTTELWFLILHANELTSSSQFDMEKPYVYNGGVVSMIVSALDMEKTYIDYNESIKDNLLKEEI